MAGPISRRAALILLAARLLHAERQDVAWGGGKLAEVLPLPRSRADADSINGLIQLHGRRGVSHRSSELQASGPATKNFFCSDNCQYAGDVSEVQKTMYCQFLDFDVIEQRYKDGCSHKLPGFSCEPPPDDDAMEAALKAYCVYYCGCESSELKKKCEKRHADQKNFDGNLDNSKGPTDSMMVRLEDQMLAMFDDDSRIPCEDRAPAGTRALMAQEDLTKDFPIPGAGGPGEAVAVPRAETPQAGTPEDGAGTPEDGAGAAVAPQVPSSQAARKPAADPSMPRQNVPLKFPGSSRTRQWPFTIRPMDKVCLRSLSTGKWHRAQVVATIGLPGGISKGGESVAAYGCVCMRYMGRAARSRRFTRPLGRCQNKKVHKFFCITSAKKHNGHRDEIASRGRC